MGEREGEKGKRKLATPPTFKLATSSFPYKKKLDSRRWSKKKRVTTSM